LKSAKRVWFKDKVFLVSDDVYEPAEDTFLMAEHLDVHGWVLEIGTGCGIISILAADRAERVIATDINPYAARCAKINAEMHGVSEKIDIVIGDLFAPFRENFTFNIILFNAPYLPNGEREEWRSENLIDYAWSGGKNGREVINRFIQQASKHLKIGGKILLVQSTLSDVEKTLREFRREDFKAQIIDERKSFFETITLIEAVKLGKLG